MFDLIKSKIDAAASSGKRVLSRVTDYYSFRRHVFAGFLIAQADGDFDADERAALAAFIKSRMGQFELADIIKVIKVCEEKVSFDQELGRAEMIDAIGEASGNEAQSIARLMSFIGKADGSFDADELDVAKAVCKALNISGERFGIK